MYSYRSSWQEFSVGVCNSLVPNAPQVIDRTNTWWSRSLTYNGGNHDDVIKWKHFPRYWPFVRGIHRLTVNSPHKGQWRGALMFSLICTRINTWVNNHEADDLRRHRAHYDVIVMDDGICLAEEIFDAIKGSSLSEILLIFKSTLPATIDMTHSHLPLTR